MFRTISVAALSVWIAASPSSDPIEDRVVNDAARTNFTYHSSVQANPNSKFKLTNFIRNNRADSPLSVQWKDADIFCVGSQQLPPGATDYGNSGSMITSPAAVPSRIRYGATLQYPAPARVYIEPKGQEETDTVTSEYRRELSNGSVPLRIQVTSTLDSSRQTSMLTIRVTGGLNLAIPMKLGGSFKDNATVNASRTWKLVETTPVDEFSLRDGSHRDLARDWLRTNDQVGYFYFVSLMNLSKDANDITIRVSGRDWTIEKINLIGFDEARSGMVGMAARVHIPRRPN